MNLLKQYIVIFLAVLVTACGGSGDSAPAPQATAPVITSFVSASPTITAGTSVNLTAVFTNGTANIDNGLGVVTTGAPVSVNPASNTTYTLTVTNVDGVVVTSSVTVTVAAPPVVTSFNSSATTITVGDSVNLTAVFTGGSASIDNSLGSVTTGSAVSVSPVSTTTYTLTVTNAAGTSATSTVTVTVVAAPVVTSFTSSATTITAGNSVNLTANFSGGSASIDNSVGNIASGVANSVSPTTTTTYTVTVTNAAGASVTSNVTVTVVAAPFITSFTSNKTDLVVGESVNLTAVFSDGTASIDNSVGVVTSGNSISVAPTTTTTYTVTVTNAVGSIVSSTVTITVNVLELTDLSVTGVSLDQVFQSNQPDYTATVGFLAQSVTVNATTATPGATVSVNGVDVDADSNSGLISLTEGVNAAVNIVVTSSGGITNSYTLTLTRQVASAFAEQAYVKASNSSSSDRFGSSVTISGDTLAVGVPYEGSSTTGVNSTANDLAANSGAVYVFTRSGTTWSQQAYIKASNTGNDDFFGAAVALSGDTLAVGAYQEDSSTMGINTTPDDDLTNSSNSGAVYVFSRSGSTWSQDAYIKPAYAGGPINARFWNYFGHSVALSGDTLAVGAYGERSDTTGFNSTQNANAPVSGAAYIFTRTGGTWSQDAYLKASNTGANDMFGFSVALSGDLLAVGASGEDSSTSGINTTPNESAFQSGAAYVFLRTNETNWNQLAYIKASNPSADDYFGASVALSGGTLAVGAYAEDSGTTGVNTTPDTTTAADSGAVYVYTLDGVIWTQQAYIKASNAGADDLFGRSVALSGDTLAVGATREDSSTSGINTSSDDLASNSGAAYVFNRIGSTWSETIYIKASNVDVLDGFSSVALSGDTLVVGAAAEASSTTGINTIPDNLLSGAGAVYVFE